jgi:hypothetical protein
MKKIGVPTYALVISAGIPALYALATITLLISGQPAGTSLAAIVLAVPELTIFLVLNGFIALIGGVVARKKGRKFGAFYFLGLFFPLVPTLVALLLRPTND